MDGNVMTICHLETILRLGTRKRRKVFLIPSLLKGHLKSFGP